MKTKEKTPAIGGNLAGDTKIYNDGIIHCDSDYVKLSFKGHEIKTLIDKDLNLWWVAADVCRTLGLSNVTMAIQSLDNDERAKLNLGRQGETNVISEAGLYSLILSSRKKNARDFKRWVTHDVLPAIRKQGFYVAPRLTQLDIVKARNYLLIREHVRLPLSQYGSISKRTGLPRTKPICYFRSDSRNPTPVDKDLQLTFDLFGEIEKLGGAPCLEIE